MIKDFSIKLNTIDKVKLFDSMIHKTFAEVDIISGRYVIDAKSIMGIFSLDLSKTLTLRVHLEDESELSKFEEIEKMFQ